MWDRCRWETDLIKGAFGPGPNTAASSLEEAGYGGIKTNCAQHPKAKGILKEGRRAAPGWPERASQKMRDQVGPRSPGKDLVAQSGKVIPG